MKTRKFLSVFLAVVMMMGMIPGTTLTAFAAEHPATDLTLTTKNGSTEANTFTYGDVITIEATAVSGSTVASNQTISVYSGDQPLSTGVHITSVAENGTYIIMIDTKYKALDIGEQTLTVKFEGDNTMPAAQADVTLTMNQATPSIMANQPTVSLAYPVDENILQNSISYTFKNVYGSNSVISPDSYEYRVSGSAEDFTSGLPVNVGTYEVRALFAPSDDGYYTAGSASFTLEITKLVANIQLSPAFVVTKTYDETPFIVTEDMFELNGITWDQLTLTWYKDFVDEANKLAAAPTEVGDYVLVLYAPDTTNVEEFSWQSPPVTITDAASGPAPTFYDIWVGGEQFTSEKLTISNGNGGTATYNPETNTLTLDDINITAGYTDERERVIGIYADGDLNIELTGENDITMPDDNNKSYGVRVKGDLSISGSGSLNAVAGKVIAQDSTEHYSTGIHTSGYLNIYGATVYAKGGDIFAEGESYSCGVCPGGGLEIDFRGSLTAEGGRATGRMAFSTGLEALGDEEYLNISIYDGNLIAKGGDTEGVIVAESNGAYLEFAGFYVYENTANVELTSGNAKVTSVDESNKPYACSNGITVYTGDIAIHGGKIDISSGTWEGIDGDGWAVYVDGEEDEDGVISGGNVLIEWENIELSPSGYGFIGSKVTITSTDEEKGAIFAGNGLEIGDKLIISEPENGEIAKIEEENYAFDTVLNTDDSLAKKVVIAPLIYSVKIEGLDYGMRVLVPDNTSINEAYKDMLEDAEITDFSDVINTEKSGYSFDGFYTESGEKFDFDDSVISDMTITARWTRKSYGGGSSSTTTTTTKNDDGSTTKTTTNKRTGTVTKTTTYADGSTTKVETQKDGTVITTEKNKDGSEKVTEEKADGTTVTTEKDTDSTKTVTTENADGSRATEEVRKDGTEVKTETINDGETKTEIDLPKDKETEVTIPVPDAEDVTSVVVTDKDGKETEIYDFEITEDGVKISVSSDCTVALTKAAKKVFDDVHPAGHWATAEVNYAYIKGLMMGTSETHFSPDVPLTRAMLVTVLYRLEGEPEMRDAQWFEDVARGQWYSNAVAWATFNGITVGYGDSNFGPDDNITREQIAAIMHRYADFKGHNVSVGENTNILSYDDVHHVSEYAIGAMQYAVGSGLMKGKSAATLNPLDNATRAEIAAILHRFIKANK